jgi:hypothetical protein
MTITKVDILGDSEHGRLGVLELAHSFGSKTADALDQAGKKIAIRFGILASSHFDIDFQRRRQPPDSLDANLGRHTNAQGRATMKPDLTARETDTLPRRGFRSRDGTIGQTAA